VTEPRQLQSTDLKRLHRGWRKKASRRVALILDGVASPWNVGSIVRTAAAYRVEQVWLTPETPDLDSPKVGRTALGCERYLRWERAGGGPAAIGAAENEGFVTIGIELATGATPLHEVDTTGDVCLVLGHEDHGLSKATLDACGLVAYLPQLGRVGSLNVATAAALAFYEVRRAEW
jgi:tRNA (guanosine-2'-O-)-methyltransferase